MSFPQYLKSTDPRVIEVIENNMAGRADLHRRACAFAERVGVERGAYYSSDFAGTRSVVGVSGRERPGPQWGRWKEARRGWSPYKNNRIRAEFDALEFREADIPGLPRMVRGDYNQTGGHRIAWPTPFILGGVAYQGFSFLPHSADPIASEAEWVEIKGSEYLAARESIEAVSS